jgi:hypothetical protein
MRIEKGNCLGGHFSYTIHLLCIIQQVLHFANSLRRNPTHSPHFPSDVSMPTYAKSQGISRKTKTNVKGYPPSPKSKSFSTLKLVTG